MKSPRLLSRQSFMHWTELVLLVSLIAGVLVIVNYIAYRHTRRFDLTPEKRYTLSEQTVQILHGLSSDVQVTVFFRQQERQALEDLMTLFSRASNRFQYDFIDLEKNPARAEALGIKSFGAGIVEYKGKREKINYCTEENIVSALIRLTDPTQKIIRFVQGHGEKELGGADQKTSYSSIRQALEGENYKVEELLLLQAQQVPGDTLILIVSGPQKDFLAKEIEMLDRYVRGGGRLVMLSDPFPLPNIENFLKGFQIQLSRDFVIDTQSKLLAFDYLTPIVIPDKQHQIARSMNEAVVFPVCRSVVPLTAEGMDILASSGPDSWAEQDTRSVHENSVRFDRDTDIKGPVPVAVATRVAGTEKDGQRKEDGWLIVMGNSNFATNYYSTVLGNKDFFLNTVNWLADKRQLMSTRIKTAQSPVSMFFLTENESRIVFWSSVVIEPFIIFCLGICVVIWRRVRR